MRDLTALGKANDAITQLNDISNQWQTWTPTLTWGTAIPISITAVARYKVIGKTVFFTIYVSATDGNGAVAPLTATLPVIPKTNIVFPAITCRQSVGGTVSARSGYVRDNGTNNDVTVSLTTSTALSALLVYISGFYEID